MTINIRTDFLKQTPMYIHTNEYYPFQSWKLRKLITHFNDASHLGSPSFLIDFSN